MDPSLHFQKNNPVFRNKEEQIQHLNKATPASTCKFLTRADLSISKPTHGFGIGYPGASLQMNTASFSYHFYCVNLYKENIFEISVVNWERVDNLAQIKMSHNPKRKPSKFWILHLLMLDLTHVIFLFYGNSFLFFFFKHGVFHWPRILA